MPPAALLFDLENTFFDGTFWHRQIHQMANRWTRPISFFDFKAAWQSNWLPRVYSGQLEYWQAMSEFFDELGIDGCARIELLTAAKARLKTAQASLRAYSGVAEALRDLQQSGYKLGILSNSIMLPEETLDLLQRIGISVHWDYCFTSRAAGQTLPTPFAFHSAARGLAIRPGEAVYISCNRERLQAAAEIGMQTGMLVVQGPTGRSASENSLRCLEFVSFSEIARQFAVRKAA